MKVSDENKELARYIRAAFGGECKVQAFHHDELPLTVHIVVAEDTPEPGLTAYSTVSLSDYPMFDEGEEFPTRIEIAGVSDSANELFPSALATAAFIVMRTQTFVYPGRVLPDCVSEYYPDCQFKHFYFTAPFLWEEELETIELETKTVTWLMAVPISDAECEFLCEYGDGALEERFQAADIDVADLSRESCL